MAKKSTKNKNWIQGAIKRPGALTKKAQSANMTVPQFTSKVLSNKGKYSPLTVKQANLAKTLRKFQDGGANETLPNQMRTTSTITSPGMASFAQLQAQANELTAYNKQELERKKAEDKAAEESKRMSLAATGAQFASEAPKAIKATGEAIRAASSKTAKAATKGAEIVKDAGTVASATGKFAPQTVPGLGTVANIGGELLMRASDDKDPTKYNAGETTGTLLKGAGSGLSAAGMLASMAPALAIPGIGWAAAGVGALTAGAIALHRRNKARKEKEKLDAEKASERNNLNRAFTESWNQAYKKSGTDMGYNIGSSSTNSYLPGQQQMAKKGGAKKYQPGGPITTLQPRNTAVPTLDLGVRAETMDRPQSRVDPMARVQADRTAHQAAIARQNREKETQARIAQMQSQGAKIDQALGRSAAPSLPVATPLREVSIAEENRNIANAKANQAQAAAQQLGQNVGQVLQNPEVAMDATQLALQGIAASEIPLVSQGAGLLNTAGYLGRAGYYGYKALTTDDLGYGAKSGIYAGLGGLSLAGVLPVAGAAADASAMGKLAHGLHAAHSSGAGHLAHNIGTTSKISGLAGQGSLLQHATGTYHAPEAHANPQFAQAVPHKTGGKKVEGGMIKPLQSGAVEFIGRTHKQGGIIIDPETEVENGETMDKVEMKSGGSDYIFSNYLKLGGKTFAQRHKEILNRKGSQKEIQDLAKMQEAVAAKDGETNRTPDSVMQNGGIRKYQTAGEKRPTMASEGWWLDNMPRLQQLYLQEKSKNPSLTVEEFSDNLGIPVGVVKDVENSVPTQTQTQTQAYNNPNPWQGSPKADWAIQGKKGIDRETIIGKNPQTGDLSKEQFGDFYGNYPGYRQNPNKFYEEVYIPRVQEYFRENPDEAYSRLKEMVAGNDPNADNFRKKLLDKDGNMLPRDQALAEAERLATDKQVGSFHMILPEELLPRLEPNIKNDLPPREIIGGKKPEDPKTPPGLIPPDIPIIPLGWAQLAGPISALRKKYPEAQTAYTSPVGRINLPRVNYNAERAANANQTNALQRSIENSSSGPAGMALRMGAMSTARQADLDIANAEAQVNKSLMAEEAAENLRADMANAQIGADMAQFNAQLRYQSDINKYDNRLNAVNQIGNILTNIGMGYRQDLADERVARAVQINGEYDRERIKSAAKLRNTKVNVDGKDVKFRTLSPTKQNEVVAMMYLGQNNPAQAQEFLKQDRETRAAAYATQPETKTEETTEQKKKGGKRYLSKFGKVKQTRRR
jgi:hypothetical protein